MKSTLAKLRDKVGDRFRVFKKQRKEKPAAILTRYATVYGDSLAWAFQEDPYRGKSGITPRRTSLGQAILSPFSNLRSTVFDIYEGEQLTFTTQQAFDVGAIVDYKAKPSNLQNELFQGFRRDRWRKKGTHPMDDGTGRNWSMHDDAVYETCLPALRLASRMISHAQNNDWWDALIAGERRSIPESRFPFMAQLNDHDYTDLQLKSFHRRTPEERLKNPCNWETLVNEIELEIRGSEENTDTLDFWAMTMSTLAPGDEEKLAVRAKIVLRVNPRLLYPLFYLPINENERLVHQFFVAATMVHEYAHAIAFEKDRPLINLDMDHPQTFDEPIFEDEVVAEAGFSAENALFGGTLSDYPRLDPREHPPNPAFSRGGLKMFTAVTTYPHWADLQQSNKYDRGVKLLPTQPHGTESELNLIVADPIATSRLIPLRFIQDMQQEDFWNVQVNKFGGQGLRLFPEIFSYVERGKVGDGNFYQDSFETKIWDIHEEWKAKNRPNPWVFAGEKGFTGYDLVRVPDALRTFDRLDERRKEKERQLKHQEKLMVGKKMKRVRKWWEEYERDEEEWNRKRKEVYERLLVRMAQDGEEKKIGVGEVVGEKGDEVLKVENLGNGQLADDNWQEKAVGFVIDAGIYLKEDGESEEDVEEQQVDVTGEKTVGFVIDAGIYLPEDNEIDEDLEEHEIYDKEKKAVGFLIDAGIYLPEDNKSDEEAEVKDQGKEEKIEKQNEERKDDEDDDNDRERDDDAKNRNLKDADSLTPTSSVLFLKSTTDSLLETALQALNLKPRIIKRKPKFSEIEVCHVGNGEGDSEWEDVSSDEEEAR